ncbi:MAG: hopanoid biosynthesis-associated protein HpnK [Candidatus Eremiobacteraeota bacterium]|nr:hopanoid biosynthesis-associated protein HpnK [Candidatus Eremiobacteraeota bacterium]
MKRLILTADDFGAAPEVNEAVEIAHRDSVLRSASLMVGAPAFSDAVERAKRLPDLAVGLHVVLVNGRPVLPVERVPALVDKRGLFFRNLVGAGVRFFFHPGVRSQLAAEIRAQFEAFARTGLQLDHVNAQNHMHVHPTVFGLIVQIGRGFGLHAIRIPQEPFGRTRTIAPWLFLMRRRVRAAGLTCNDYVLGLNDAGAMTEPRVLHMLETLPNGVTEMLFHPAVRPLTQPDRGAEHFAWMEELRALTSARVREAIIKHGITLTTYGELAARSGSG